MPAKMPETPVPCTGCPNVSVGSLTTGYKAPIATFTGRYLDSSNTSEWFKPFRTARSKYVLAMPALDRIYFRYGDGSVASYKLSTFFTRLETGEKLAYWAPDGQFYRGGNPEVWLKWDTWFNPELGGSGWTTNQVDGSLRMTFFDVDDQGYVYIASTLYGWGIVKDTFGTLGGVMPTMVQKYPGAKGDSAPNMIAAVKGATKYYAVLGRQDMWDVTDRKNPVKLSSTNVPALYHFARNAAADRIAIIDNTSTLTINTGDGFASGTTPLYTGSGFNDVTSDGTNFFALRYPDGIVVLSPSGNSYAQTRTSAIDPKFAGANSIRYGDGYLVLTGSDTGGGWDARVYKVGADLSATAIVTNASFGDGNYPSYFRNYYGIPPSSQFVVPAYINMLNGTVVKVNGKTYLIICAKGLGDVYELGAGGSVQPCAPMTSNSFVPTFNGSAGCSPSQVCQSGETLTLIASAPPLGGYDPSCAFHTYFWYLNGVQVATGSPATYTATTSGSLTVTISNGTQTMVYPSSGALTLTVGAAPPNPCGTLASNNLLISYTGNQGCTTPNACKNGEAITFKVDPYLYSFTCAPHQFTWNFGDGSSASGSQVTHSFSTAGSHNVTVTVTNQYQPSGVTKPIFLTTIDTQPVQCPTMTANNIAIAFNGLSSNCSSGTAQPCNNGETIQFDATSYAGYDFNCSTHSFTWNFGDGGTATGKSPTHSFSSSGSHPVTVTISNATQQNFQRQITVTTGVVGCGTITSLSLFIDYHNAVNSCGPLTTAQCSAGEPLTFTIGQFGSYDMNCAPHTFDWDFGDGTPHGSGKDVVHQYAVAGTYTAKCTVNNGSQQVTLQQQVTIGNSSGGGGDIQITPVITPMTGAGQPANTYSFNAQVTGAPAGALYVWNFGDGAQQTGLTVTHTYAAAGKYTVTLSVYSSTNQLLKTQSTVVGGEPKRRSVRH
ncbi:MAG TPA: PKD domain-containing protein [Thermoanaerobaculia bacterium]|nr:PKD domain-containing protein [Thermoanaerobaculia bacterium]